MAVSIVPEAAFSKALLMLPADISPRPRLLHSGNAKYNDACCPAEHKADAILAAALTMCLLPLLMPDTTRGRLAFFRASAILAARASISSPAPATSGAFGSIA